MAAPETPEPVYDSALLQAHAERWRKLRHLQGTLRPLTDFLPQAAEEYSGENAEWDDPDDLPAGW